MIGRVGERERAKRNMKKRNAEIISDFHVMKRFKLYTKNDTREDARRLPPATETTQLTIYTGGWCLSLPREVEEEEQRRKGRNFRSTFHHEEKIC